MGTNNRETFPWLYPVVYWSITCFILGGCSHIDNIRGYWEVCLSPFFIRWNWLLWDHTDLRLCFPWCTTNRGKRVLEYLKTMLWKTVPTTSSTNSIDAGCISRRSEWTCWRSNWTEFPYETIHRILKSYR